MPFVSERMLRGLSVGDGLQKDSTVIRSLRLSALEVELVISHTHMVESCESP